MKILEFPVLPLAAMSLLVACNSAGDGGTAAAKDPNVELPSTTKSSVPELREAAKGENRADDLPLRTKEEIAARYPVRSQAEARTIALRQDARMNERLMGLPARTPPEQGPPTVSFGFPDLTTSVGATPLLLLVNHVGVPISRDALREIERKVSLRRWPGLEKVAHEIELEPAEGEDANARVRVVPEQPLDENAWYALVVERLSTAFDWADFSPALVDKEDRHVTRFFVGEQPVVSSVRVCQDRSIYLDFSERIRVEDGQFSFTAGSSSVACVLDGESGGSTLSARFSCNAEVDRVAIVGQSSSLSGKELRAKIDVNRLEPWGDGCRIHRPDPVQR